MTKCETRRPSDQADRTHGLNQRASCVASGVLSFVIRHSSFVIISSSFPLAIVALLSLGARAAVPLPDNSSSLHAAVRGVSLAEVRWTGGFWFDRFENLRTNMLPAMVRLMEGTNDSQY